MHAVVDLLRRLLVAVHVDDDRDRAVEAGPEALRQEVVGPAGSLLLRLRALVGRTEADERRRACQRQDQDQHDREHDLRVRGHEAAPAGDRSLLPRLLGVVEPAEEGHLPPVDLVPQLCQHRDQQRVRDRHGREDAERRADAELGDEVEAEEGQAGDRDRDRQAGEEHGAARGGTGLGGGVDRRQPFVQELPEAGDDEQRVVDADTEPDHRHEQRRDRVDVGQAGEDEEQDERGRQRRQREQNRDRHRHEGAEDDDQDDQRRQQAEQLLRFPARSAGTRRRRCTRP